MSAISPLAALQAPIAIGGWSEDEEFGIHPYGSKAKRTLLCPAGDPDNPLLISGHRYLFKRAEDWRAQQLWSEVIAYQLGAAVGLPVPPAFVGIDSETGQSGALIEFFYGYPNDVKAARLEHGADLLQGAGLMDGNGQPHAVTINLAYCEANEIDGAREWWGRVLAFDALIGNTDRHSENWGFLVDEHGGRLMAPMFDNGTSLAYLIGEGSLEATMQEAKLSRFINRGRHSCDWSEEDASAFNHVGMCEQYGIRHPEIIDTMIAAVSIDNAAVEGFLHACTAIDVSPRFTPQRADLVAALTLRRRDLILQALERGR